LYPQYHFFAIFFYLFLILIIVKFHSIPLNNSEPLTVWLTLDLYLHPVRFLSC